MKTLKYYIEKLKLEFGTADRKQWMRDVKAGRRGNIYALGLMLEAMERLEAAVSNAANLDSSDPDAARMLAHQICKHCTNTPPARKVVKLIVKEHALSFTAWEGYRDCINFLNGSEVK